MVLFTRSATALSLGVPALGHAYAYFAVLQTGRVGIARILYTPVGMMD